jgi:hypothetical protein
MSDGSATKHRGSWLWLAIMLILALALGIGTYLVLTRVQLDDGIDGCTKLTHLDSRRRCYTKEFRAMVREEGLQKALATVDRKSTTDRSLMLGCHLAWHTIGEEAGRRAARRHVPIDATDTAGHCSSGYIHGVFIGYLGTNAVTNPSKAASRLVSMCVDAEARGNSAVQCVHSFGHAFARSAPGEVAADTCLEIPDTKSLPDSSRHECLYGMFMQLTLDDEVKGVTEPLDNCRAYTGKEVLDACYQYLPVRVGTLTQSWKTTAKTCDAVPKAYHDICVERFSRGADTLKQCSYLAARADQARCRTLAPDRASG